MKTLQCSDQNHFIMSEKPKNQHCDTPLQMVVHMLLRITEVTEITVSYPVSLDCSCGQDCLGLVGRKSGQSVTSRTKSPTQDVQDV